MLRTIALAAALAVAPAAAFAHMCPALMAEIDAAMPQASISAEVQARVMELRETGEALHLAGDHDGSVAALNEAKELLGL